MPPPTPPSGNGTPGEAEDLSFSVMIGGPLFQLLRRAHLSGDALEWLQRRILILSLLAWLPLLLLSLVEQGAGMTNAFLRDVEVHARFLIAMPLLIATEYVVHARLRDVFRDFLRRQLIPEGELPRFHAARASAFRLRSSVLAEVLLLALVYFGGVVVWRYFLSLGIRSWYGTASQRGFSQLSPAGVWYRFVSLPLFQFLLCRWYFRVFVWARFLRQVSRIRLELIPTHPDRVGGLGFLSLTVYAFIPLAMAHGVMLAGQIASRIIFLGATVAGFKFEILILVLFVLLLAIGPLLSFTPRLWRTKLLGEREYGTLAHAYVRDFDAKWLRRPPPTDETLLGSSDVQSLADMANSFQVVRAVRIAPFSNQVALEVVIATLAPLLPLLLTMMPLEQLMKRLFGLLF